MTGPDLSFHRVRMQLGMEPGEPEPATPEPEPADSEPEPVVPPGSPVRATLTTT